MLEYLENFDEVKTKGEELYKSLQPIHCPYFKDKIHFTSEGLEHLKFKRRNVARPRQDQYMRFKLLKTVPTILENSKTLQGMNENKEFVTERIHNRTDTVLRNVTYYEFIAVVERIRVKIIIRRIEQSVYTFWSIIPFWGNISLTNKRRLHSGNLIED
jgi:hypothetical protein